MDSINLRPQSVRPAGARRLAPSTPSRLAVAAAIVAIAWTTLLLAPGALAAVTGTKKGVVFLVTSDEFPPEDRYPWTREEVERAFFGGRGSGSLAEFFEHGSYGTFSVTGEVRDWIVSPFSSTPTQCASEGSLIQTLGNQVVPKPDFILYLFPYSPACGYHGTPGFLNGSIALRLLAHEFGHSFGFGHDSAETINLAESFDPMGGSSGECGYHALHKVALGWIPPGPPDITSSGVYELRGSDLPPDGVTPQILTVRTTIPGTSIERTYFLETRQRDPSKAFTGCMLKEPPVNGVLVRLIATTSSDLKDYAIGTPTFADAAVPVGKAMTTMEGIRIVVQSLSSSGATVAVSFVTPPTVDARIVGTELVVTGTPDAESIGVDPVTATTTVPKRFRVGSNRPISVGPGCTIDPIPVSRNSEAFCEASSAANDITAVTIDLGDGADLFRAAGWFPLTVNGGPGADTLDEVEFSNGSTTFHGGDGIDTVDYSARSIAGAEISLDGVANDGYQGPTFQSPGGVWWIQEFDNIGSDVEVLKGTQADDEISAGTNTAIIYGNDGNDVLRGGPNPDFMSGGSGDDLLIGLGGGDLMNGGAGTDVVDYTGRATPVSVVGDWMANDGEAGENDNVGGDVEQATPGTIAVLPLCPPGSVFTASSLKAKYQRVVQGRASRVLVQGKITSKADASGPTPFGARMLIEDLDSGELTRLMDFRIPATVVGSGCEPKDGWRSSTSVVYRLFSNRIPPACGAGSGNGLNRLKLVPRPDAVQAKLLADPASLPVPTGRFRVTFVEGTGVTGLTPGKCVQSPPMKCTPAVTGPTNCKVVP